MIPSPRYLVVDRLAVEIHPSRAALGVAAARAAAASLRDVLAHQAEARVIFACAPSQNEFLAELVAATRAGPCAVDWRRVHAFHMDEYVGLGAGHTQSFRHYLQTRLLDQLPGIRFHPLEAELPNLDSTCGAYGKLLAQGPIDLVCLGIGENGHIAFNDPPAADFADPLLVKLVPLDAACRSQQVNDGCFPDIAAVPKHALTLTIPIFRQARRLSIHVPGSRKAPAVKATLQDKISTSCPASILRLHPDATLYLDRESAGNLSPAIN